MIALVPEIRIFEWQIKIRGSPDKTIVEPLLKSIRDGVTVQLEELTLYIGPGLRYIEPNLVSSAVLKVEDCTIIAGLSLGQLKAILRGVIHNTNASLRSLNFGDCWNAKYVAPDILAEAAVKLEYLRVIGLSRSQMAAILARLAATPDSRLKHLDCGGSWIDPFVAPDILAEAAVKLEPLKVRDLSRSQMEAVLTRLAATPDCRLKHLRFGCTVDVRQMDPEVVKTALAKLESVGPLWT